MVYWNRTIAIEKLEEMVLRSRSDGTTNKQKIEDLPEERLWGGPMPDRASPELNKYIQPADSVLSVNSV